MPNITIVKIKVRRGTDEQRKAIVLEQGELGYTIDTKKLYIGDGVTNGGIAVAPRIFTPLNNVNSITGTAASIGEIVPAGSLIYQLTATDYAKLSSWANISTKPDNVTLEYTGSTSKVLSLKNNVIGNDSFDSSAAYSAGGIIATKNNGLSANVDGKYVVIDGNKITITSISADKISKAAIGSGLNGGDGTKLSLNIGPGFAFDPSTKALKLTSVPAGSIPIESIDVGSLYGDGLSVDNNNKLILDKPNILGIGLTLDAQNKIALNASNLTVVGGGVEYDSNIGGFYINFTPVIGSGLRLNALNKLEADVPVADNASIVTTTGSLGEDVLSIADTGIEAGVLGLPTISYNEKGQLLNAYPSFTDVLTAKNTGVLSAFNGAPDQGFNSYPYSNQTILSALSVLNGTTSTIKLTSAGFVTLEGNTTQKDGGINRFAIPIFAY